MSHASAPAREPRGDLKSRVQSLKLDDDQRHTPRGGALVPWLLCLILLATSAGLGYLAWHYRQVAVQIPQADGGAPIGDQSAAKPPPPATGTGGTTEAASGGASSAAADAIALQATGYIVPAHQILVSPKVSGMLTSLRIREGMRVASGDILATVEDTDYRADLDRANATLAAAEQQLLELERGSRPEEIEQARAELAEAIERKIELEKAWQRAEQLGQSNVATEEELVTAHRQYTAQLQRVERLQYALKLTEKGPRVERIEAARAQVRQAKAEVTRAAWRLDNCTIKAPISGTILKKNAEEGNIVNPIAFNGSFSVCEMADLSDLEVDLAIQERDIRRVFKGQRCKIRASAFLDRYYDGVVDRLMPIADRAKGAIPVRVKIRVPAEEEGVFLKPEMSAEVTFFSKSDG